MLSPQEAAAHALLAERPGETVPREAIAARLWPGPDHDRPPSWCWSVSCVMHRLRRAGHPVETVLAPSPVSRGRLVGYRLAEGAPA